MFSSKEYLPDAALARLTQTRVTDPEFARQAALRRKRRQQVTNGGKLNILAADHPARYVTRVGDRPLAMADRGDYLARILRVLSSERVDGIMATMDILEDLLSVDGFLREAGGPALLDHKLLIASLNRGGLAGSVWELDDPMTGPAPAECHSWKLDGIKILMRVDLTEPVSLKTMIASAQAVREANAVKLPIFLEPLPVTRTDKGYAVTKAASALASLAGVASALGDSSAYLWLKLPWCDDYETVARSTTLPVLLLGGESAGDPTPFLHQLVSALKAGPNVRGALVGRNVLYPGDEDPLAMAEAVGRVIYEGCSAEEALQSMKTHRGRDMNSLSRWLMPVERQGGMH